MRFQRIFLGLAILILISGLSVFAISTFQEVRSSTHTSTFNGVVESQQFSYGPLPPSGSPQVTILGTTGVGELIVLLTSFQDFNNWVCHQLPTQQLSYGLTYPDCSHFGGGYFNNTLLYSYLQTHSSQIAYSQTVVDENITVSSINYHVSTWTDATLVFAHMGSGLVRDFGLTSVTNRTTNYPLIGYNEPTGTIWGLSNISLGLIAGGIGLLAAGLLAATMASSKLELTREQGLRRGPATQKCPQCGNENLFFAPKCLHCGNMLPKEEAKMELASH